MPSDGPNLLDTILFIAGAGAVALVGLAILFGVIQAWRRRAIDRQIRKHLRK